jgi:hypothetical protein
VKRRSYLKDWIIDETRSLEDDSGWSSVREAAA